MNPELIRLCAEAFYGHDVPMPRATELAEEVFRLVEGAQFDAALPGFEDSPDRFLAALLEAAQIGIASR
jgi:hypothetical protein